MVAGDTVRYQLTYQNPSDKEADVILRITSKESVLNQKAMVNAYENGKCISSYFLNEHRQFEEIKLRKFAGNEERRYEIFLRIDKEADNRYTELDNVLQVDFIAETKESVQTSEETKYIPYAVAIILCAGAIVCVLKKKAGEENEKDK